MQCFTLFNSSTRCDITFPTPRATCNIYSKYRFSEYYFTYYCLQAHLLKPLFLWSGVVIWGMLVEERTDHVIGITRTYLESFASFYISRNTTLSSLFLFLVHYILCLSLRLPLCDEASKVPFHRVLVANTTFWVPECFRLSVWWLLWCWFGSTKIPARAAICSNYWRIVVSKYRQFNIDKNYGRQNVSFDSKWRLDFSTLF